MDGEDFGAKLRRLAPEIDEALRRWALPERKPVANLDDAVGYALGFGVEDAGKRGKRIRPALAVLTCEALGGRRVEVMPFAVAVELMHNFFLVHDDIEDGDEMRHGRPTVWRRYGLAHGVNVGDYLHARISAVLLRSLDCGVSPATLIRLFDLLAETLDHTHRGQALDINARSSAEISVEQYLEMVREKTGYYLAAPVIGGAIVAGAPDEVVAAIREFGAAVGPMFQIMDDLIDLTESKGRGSPGADIREGKRSFMVAFALSRLSPAERDELLAVLDRPRAETTPEDVARAVEIFEECGAIEQARLTIGELGRRAREATSRMPESLGRLLVGATDYLERRTR